MIGGDPRSIPGAPAAEHGQSEHARLVADAGAFHKLEIENGKDMCHPATRQVWRPTRRKHQAPKSKLQRSTNIQTSNLEAKDLERGVCCFSGAWCLEFGAYFSSPAIFVFGNASTRAFFAP